MSAGEGRGLFGIALTQAGEVNPEAGQELGPEWVKVLGSVPLLAALSARHLRRVAETGAEDNVRTSDDHH